MRRIGCRRRKDQEEGSRRARPEGITGSCSPGVGGVCANPPWGPGLPQVGLPSWGESRLPTPIEPQELYSQPIHTRRLLCRNLLEENVHSRGNNGTDPNRGAACQENWPSPLANSAAGQRAPTSPPHGSGNFSKLKFFKLETSGGKRTQGLLHSCFMEPNGPLWERLGHPHGGAFPGLRTD